MATPVADLLISCAEPVARLFGGLSAPTRLRILGLTIARPWTVKELVRVLRMTQPHVSRQLQLLCELNLLIRATATGGGRADSYRANATLVPMVLELASIALDQRPDS